MGSSAGNFVLPTVCGCKNQHLSPLLHVPCRKNRHGVFRFWHGNATMAESVAKGSGLALRSWSNLQELPSLQLPEAKYRQSGISRIKQTQDRRIDRYGSRYFNQMEAQKYSAEDYPANWCRRAACSIMRFDEGHHVKHPISRSN